MRSSARGHGLRRSNVYPGTQMQRAHLFAHAVIAIAALGACRPGPVRPVDLSPLPSPEEALETVRSSGAARRTLRASGRVTYFGERGRVRLRAVLLAARDGSFRFETLSPMEQPIDVMACDGARLWLLSNDRLREGPATPENIARLLPLPMRPEEVVDTLLGGVPTSSRFVPKTIARDDEGRWVVTLRSASLESARLVVDPVRKVVESMSLADPLGSERVSVAFSDFEAVKDGSGLVPTEIVIKMRDQEADVRIKLISAEVNVQIDPGLFRIVGPPGVAPEPLDSPAAPAR